MLIGIDVGGTFTDGVLFGEQTVLATVKQPTDDRDLKNTLLKVLDELLKERGGQEINRIVLSTTLVTNLLATERGDRTALLILPGPGLPLETYRIFADTYFLKGSIDFRGRELEVIDRGEVIKALEAINALGIKKIAVVGKFSNRNNKQEQEVSDIIQDRYPEIQVAIGSETAGQLNFLRRIVTTYYSAMTRSAWEEFVEAIKKALVARKINATVDILKADGGTMPLLLSNTKPCETVFSGPAASTMGAVALTMEACNSVVIDIGGTTSDITLLIDGHPLYASKGARIQGHYTHINAFSVRSIPMGGDSPLTIENGNISVESRRRGVAACFGGQSPTVTDVFNHKYHLEIGNLAQSTEILSEMCGKNNMDKNGLCQAVEDIVIERLQTTITEMFKEWENEPAYRVWEVVHGRRFDVQEIIGIGAASASIVPVLARRMQVAYRIPVHAEVANALGACVARPTLALKLHIDTQNGYYTIDQEGLRGSIPLGKSMQMQDARDLAQVHLLKMAQERGMERYAADAECYLEEQFNVIRGWNTAGKIFDVGVQISPGFIEEYQGVRK